MAEIRELRESTLKEIEETHFEVALHAKFCAYNRTGKRFVSNDVALANVLSAEVKQCFEELGPGSASAVWMIPIRRLLPVDFRIPVDLLYLNEQCEVLGIIQSFPIERMILEFADATSILVLPAQSAIMSGIEPGNRLLICSRDEMQDYLLHPQSRLSERLRPQLVVPQVASKDSPETSSAHPNAAVWKWDGQLEQAELAAPEVAAAELAFTPPEKTPETKQEDSTAEKAETAEPARLESAAAYTPPQKTLWQKLLRKKATDPRKAARIALPGLVAYFFTGSAPIAHRVRNLSTTGLYVLTSERWYPGTVVRITLTDEREPTMERSITVHARVIRSTDDGVALQFVRAKADELRSRVTISEIDPLTQVSSKAQMEEFMERFESRS